MKVEDLNNGKLYTIKQSKGIRIFLLCIENNIRIEICDVLKHIMLTNIEFNIKVFDNNNKQIKINQIEILDFIDRKLAQNHKGEF